MKGHSTGCQLLECFNEWTWAVKNCMNVDICNIDVSEALVYLNLHTNYHNMDYEVTY